MLYLIRLNVAPIRRQIDELYRNLHSFCDVFEGKEEESNELLTGLKNLYKDSDQSEQILIMTISLKKWELKKDPKLVSVCIYQ